MKNFRVWYWTIRLSYVFTQVTAESESAAAVIVSKQPDCYKVGPVVEL